MSDQQQRDPVVVKAIENGPYQIKGPVRVVDHDNNEYDLGPGKTRVLCRCGLSANKPLCDGSHAREGFVAEERSSAESGE
ncbi:CDGSH iron-sulfur domain-containing protein [Actinopolyspora erythraea]|uniref:CDGSH iron-sulfur domain-containing protein n=1 Tax=Actinopolyspora erythraea TaxID=414996 RepID=A0A099D4L7_9ACTN|nr:CDGSH iron-sulfur domain-containing protein [Actinopolyspora erythraea]ASU78976.1 CDGSH iron-sulfur domain-containing protein [Actinopolyspora erythraea]KGI81103.1 hypothetical protein IL38_12620 [Actinopolyspora erythraea]